MHSFALLKNHIRYTNMKSVTAKRHTMSDWHRSTFNEESNFVKPGRLIAELKGSIGEGPNHSNFSDQSSVTILAKFRNFRQKIKKIQDISTISYISAKFR